MRWMIPLFLAVGAAPAWAAAPKPAAVKTDASPSFKKVMIVIFENTGYPAALHQPFFAKLAKEGALLSSFYAETHPSQPNYIALVAGDTLGVDSDRSVVLDQTSIADLLEAAHKSWKVYAEDYPGDCFLKAKSGKYVRKHVPFLSFKNITADPARCANIVDAKALAADIKAGGVPDFSLYVPNLNDDGHDTDPSYADGWYSAAFGPLLTDPKFTQDLLLVTTFDEDDNAGGGNQIYTSLYGSMVTPGYVSANRYDHYSLLRTVEDALGAGTLGRNDAQAAPISGVWK